MTLKKKPGPEGRALPAVIELGVAPACLADSAVQPVVHFVVEDYDDVDHGILEDPSMEDPSMEDPPATNSPKFFEMFEPLSFLKSLRASLFVSLVNVCVIVWNVLG